MIMYAVGALVFIIAVTGLIKAFNAPKLAEQERLKQEAKAKAQDEKRDDRSARRQDRLDRKDARKN